MLLTETGRIMRKTLRPLVVDTKWKQSYDILGILGSTFLLNYLVVAFISRDSMSVWRAWSALGFIGHILMVLPIVCEKVGVCRWIRGFHTAQKLKKRE